MSVIKGHAGGIYITKPTCVLVVKRFTINDEVDMIDTTPICRNNTGGAKSFTGGLSEWSVEAEGQVDPTSGHWTGPAPIISPGQEVRATMYLHPTNDSACYAGTGHIKNLKPVLGVDGVLEFQFVIQGDSTLQYPTTLPAY